MPNLEIMNRDSVLVVDSRLIAEELGIQHNSFKDTITRYANDLKDFGRVEICSGTLETNGGIQSTTYYFLNEAQATFTMTLSRNTEQVVKAKKNLVTAFTLAKEKLNEQKVDLQVMFNLITNLQSNLNILTERTQKLDEVTHEKLKLEEKLEEIDDAGFNNPGAYSVIKADMEQIIGNNYVTVDQFLALAGIKITDSTKLNRIRRRAPAFYRASKFKEPLKNKKNQPIYSGSEIEYIKAAIKSEIGYIFN